jgi:hypothetical protein
VGGGLPQTHPAALRSGMRMGFETPEQRHPLRIPTRAMRMQVGGLFCVFVLAVVFLGLPLLDFEELTFIFIIFLFFAVFIFLFFAPFVLGILFIYINIIDKLIYLNIFILFIFIQNDMYMK